MDWRVQEDRRRWWQEARAAAEFVCFDSVKVSIAQTFLFRQTSLDATSEEIRLVNCIMFPSVQIQILKDRVKFEEEVTNHHQWYCQFKLIFLV